MESEFWKETLHMVFGTRCDEYEAKFKYGDRVIVTDGFYKGKFGIVKRLKPSPDHFTKPFVGYYITLNDGLEIKDPIYAGHLTLYDMKES